MRKDCYVINGIIGSHIRSGKFSNQAKKFRSDRIRVLGISSKGSIKGF